MWKDVTVVRKKLGRKCTQFGETHVIAFTAFLFQKYRNPMPMTKWQKIWQHDINVKRRIIFTNFMKVKPNVYLGLTLKFVPLKIFDFQTYFNILFLHLLEICRFVCPWGTCWSAWDTWSGSLWQSHTAPVKMIKSDFFRQKLPIGNHLLLFGHPQSLQLIQNRQPTENVLLHEMVKCGDFGILITTLHTSCYLRGHSGVIWTNKPNSQNYQNRLFDDKKLLHLPKF